MADVKLRAKLREALRNLTYSYDADGTDFERGLHENAIDEIVAVVMPLIAKRKRGRK